MKKYQIVEISENYNHAGSKATQDIAEIADQLGYQRIIVRMNTTKKTKLAKVKRQIGYRKDWANCLKTVEDNFASASISLSSINQRENTF